MSPTSAAPAVAAASPPVAAKPPRQQTQARGGERFDRELASAHETARRRDDVASKPGDETTGTGSDADAAPGAVADPVTQPAAPQSPTTDAASAATGGATATALAAAAVPVAVPVAVPAAVAGEGSAAPAGDAAAVTSVSATAGGTATATTATGSPAAAPGVTPAHLQTGDGEDAGTEATGVDAAPSAGPGVSPARGSDPGRTGKASTVAADRAPQAPRGGTADGMKAGSGSAYGTTVTTAAPAQPTDTQQVTSPAALTSATPSAPPVSATTPAPTAVSSSATPSSATPSSAVPLTAQLLTTQLGPRALAAAVAATSSGLHTINVQLRPAQLGTIQVVATLGDQGLTLHLHAASDATREVLRSALADLRADLDAGGITDLAGLDVSDRAPDQQSWGGSSEGRSSSHSAGGPVVTTGSSVDIPAVPTLLPSRDSRRVDLRV